jgi:hypothetical protein
VSMTQDEFDMLGIALQCCRPDPLACYERLASHQQSEAEPCLRCPVASWVTTMAFSGRWMDEASVFEELASPAR